MPNPPDGLAWLVDEQLAPSGEVSRSVRAQLPDLGQDDEEHERDLDVHYTLSGALLAGHDRRIVANKPIIIEAPSLFTKFEVMIFNNVTGFVGLDREASSNPGAYDRRVPGSAVDDQRCQPHKMFSIVFTVVPADPVEVHLYGGRHAQAK